MADKFVKLVTGVLVEAEADHGLLGGLGDDDHTQYHNNTRGDARYPLKDGVGKDHGRNHGAREPIRGRSLG